MVKSLREIKEGGVHGNVSLGERLGICGHTNSLIVLLLHQHSVGVLKLRRLMIVSIQVKNLLIGCCRGIRVPGNYALLGRVTGTIEMGSDSIGKKQRPGGDC